MKNSVNTIAPLKNVAAFAGLMDRVINRPAHLPGIGVFYGFSGYGKTQSAVYAANTSRAYYLEVGSSWAKKDFLRNMCRACNVADLGTVAAMVERLIEALAMDMRPVIIDEFDFITDKKYHELVREIHDKSGAAFILIGEELLPGKIQMLSERFHNRILHFEAAQPSDASDAAHLVKLYYPEIKISNDLLTKITTTSRGQIRRICINLDAIFEEAKLKGLKEITLADWNNKPLSTGAAPKRRVS